MSEYYIASLKHTQNHHEHIVWWGPERRGYTPVVGETIGTYSEEEAAKLNDGEDCIAIPVEVVRAILSPEPYWKPGARFYDLRGPVVLNDRGVWNVLIEKSLTKGRTHKARPSTHRGSRRSFAWTEGAAREVKP